MMIHGKSGLGDVFKAYEIVDASVRLAAASVRPACVAGCAECCKQPIPLTPAEGAVLMDFASHRMPLVTRLALYGQLKKNLALDAAKRPCPFLLKGICQAYEARPIACRRFLVANRQCTPGEDPSDSRPQDMIVPSRKALDMALLALYPWHEANFRPPAMPAPVSGSVADRLQWLRHITTIIQYLDWEKFFAPGNVQPSC